MWLTKLSELENSPKVSELTKDNKMKIQKANTRDKKKFKKKNGMRISGASVKLIQEILIKKAGKK